MTSARELFHQAKMTGVGVSPLQLYRLERYSECKSVYTDLIRNSQDEYEEERKTNLSAVVAAMSQWEKAPSVNVPPQNHVTTLQKHNLPENNCLISSQNVPFGAKRFLYT